MKCTKQSVIGVHPCSFTGNEIYRTKLPLFASKEKHVGKKHYLFLHKDFDRSKKLSQFTFNGQNFFFLANTLYMINIVINTDHMISKLYNYQNHPTMDHSPINQNFELNKSRQIFHRSLKEHHKISNIPKFRCKMLENVDII